MGSAWSAVSVHHCIQPTFLRLSASTYRYAAKAAAPPTSNVAPGRSATQRRTLRSMLGYARARGAQRGALGENLHRETLFENTYANKVVAFMVPLLLPLLLLCLAPLAAAAPAKPKHIIMLVIDDYGFADASYKAHMYNGTAPPPTPHLDELAMAGVRLESHCKATRRVFCPSLWRLRCG